MDTYIVIWSGGALESKPHARYAKTDIDAHRIADHLAEIRQPNERIDVFRFSGNSFGELLWSIV